MNEMNDKKEMDIYLGFKAIKDLCKEPISIPWNDFVAQKNLDKIREWVGVLEEEIKREE